MFYGYALYYKDIEGFEIPLFHRHARPGEIVLITPYKDIADRWLEDEIKTLKEELSPSQVEVTVGYLWWKKKLKFPGRFLDQHEFRFKSQVYNTIFVKKVKMA